MTETGFTSRNFLSYPSRQDWDCSSHCRVTKNLYQDQVPTDPQRN